jgi:hypothetical protein
VKLSKQQKSMEEVMNDKLDGNGNCDADNFNWQSGEQEPSKASAYIRPAKMPEKSDGKAKQFVGGEGKPIEIEQVKRLGTVDVRRPRKSEWFRAHPEMLTEVLLIQRDDVYYAVHPDIAGELGDEVRPAFIVGAINDDNALFLWPILKPKADGNGGQLFDQALEDLALSRASWVRRQWDRGAKTYRIAQAKTDKEPEWPPNCDIIAWVEKGFKNSFIDDLEHPVVRRLRGELL